MPLERYRGDASFSCRILSLIPYGLRAVLKLAKSGHSVFRDTQIDVVIHPTENRTSLDGHVHCMISFLWDVNFPKRGSKPRCFILKTALHQAGKRIAWFLLFKRNFFQGRKVECTSHPV